MIVPTTAEARVRTASCSVERISRIDPTPCEIILREPDHMVGLQLQRRQSFSMGRFEVSGAAVEFGEIGRLLVVPAEMPLHVRAEGGPTSTVRCCFSQRSFARITGLDELVHPSEAVACLDVKSPRIVDTLTRMGGELQAPGFASPLLLESLGVSLMIELARYIHELQPRPAIRRGGLSRRTHRQIIELIESENRPPSIQDLSTLTGLSRRHLSRAFKQTTGWTIYDYVERVRFNRAAALLADTDLLIKDIAFKLGFSCSSSFSVAFRRAAGESAKAYRKRVRPQSPANLADESEARRTQRSAAPDGTRSSDKTIRRGVQP